MVVTVPVLWKDSEGSCLIPNPKTVQELKKESVALLELSSTVCDTTQLRGQPHRLLLAMSNCSSVLACGHQSVWYSPNTAHPKPTALISDWRQRCWAPGAQKQWYSNHSNIWTQRQEPDMTWNSCSNAKTHTSHITESNMTEFLKPKLRWLCILTVYWQDPVPLHIPVLGLLKLLCRNFWWFSQLHVCLFWKDGIEQWLEEWLPATTSN